MLSLCYKVNPLWAVVPFLFIIYHSQRDASSVMIQIICIEYKNMIDYTIKGM